MSATRAKTSLGNQALGRAGRSWSRCAEPGAGSRAGPEGDVSSAAQCEGTSRRCQPWPRQLQHRHCSAELMFVNVWILLRSILTAAINPSVYLLTCCIRGVIFQSAPKIHCYCWRQRLHFVPHARFWILFFQILALNRNHGQQQSRCSGGTAEPGRRSAGDGAGRTAGAMPPCPSRPCARQPDQHHGALLCSSSSSYDPRGAKSVLGAQTLMCRWSQLFSGFSFQHRHLHIFYYELIPNLLLEKDQTSPYAFVGCFLCLLLSHYPGFEVRLKGTCESLPAG